MSHSKEYIKKRTIEIYDSLPQDRELRMKCIKERDEIIDLNYAFFGYIATKTFINNSSISYEDKFQSAVMHFCECWWWYHWDGDEHHKGYRKDLAFTVFFKPRIAEMIERELNEVKYSIRRSICMEALSTVTSMVADWVARHGRARMPSGQKDRKTTNRLSSHFQQWKPRSRAMCWWN